MGRVVRELGRQVGQEAQFGGAGLEEVVQHVGMVVPQQVAKAGQERVGVAHLRRPATVPPEGLVGRGRQRRGVALQQGHAVALAAHHQRGRQPGDARTRDDDLSHAAGRERATSIKS
jgi:hypothetical protein